MGLRRAVAGGGAWCDDRLVLVVGLALLAAFLFAGSASLQQHAASAVAYSTGPVSPVRTGGWRWVLRPLVDLARTLVRTRVWLLGWVTNLVGFGVQAAALHLGSVAVVQPLLVTQLLFALPLGSVWSRRWPTPRDWLSAGAICGGLAVFLTVRGVAPMAGSPDRGRAVLAGVSAAAVATVLVLAAAGRRPATHATLIAVAAGLCFAMSALLIKLTVADLVQRGVVRTALDWPGYALAASTLTGLVLEQGAFAAGSLPAAIAAMTMTNPLASYCIGVLVFGLGLPDRAGTLAGLAGSGALLSLGAVGLAHSPSVRRDNPPATGYVAGHRCAYPGR